jgi:hypothetical protein
VAEPGIAWWQDSPSLALPELHVKAGETYGRIGLRNLTAKVVKNVGIEIQVKRGDLVRGIFTQDARDIVPESESRVMSVVESGPSTARYVVRQHCDRLDPDRTWFFDYSGLGLAEATLAMTEGIGRDEFLALKTRTKLAETKDAQALPLHRWTWKDTFFEYRLWIALMGMALFVVVAVVIFAWWMKNKEQ